MRSHIVVVSPSYGGAERRFFDVFTGLRRSGVDVVFIAPSTLIDELSRRPSPTARRVPRTRAGRQLRPWSRLAFIRRFPKLLRSLCRAAAASTIRSTASGRCTSAEATRCRCRSPTARACRARSQQAHQHLGLALVLLRAQDRRAQPSDLCGDARLSHGGENEPDPGGTFLVTRPQESRCQVADGCLPRSTGRRQGHRRLS